MAHTDTGRVVAALPGSEEGSQLHVGEPWWIPDVAVVDCCIPERVVRVEPDSSSRGFDRLALAGDRAGDGREISVIGGDPYLEALSDSRLYQGVREPGSDPQVDPYRYLAVPEDLGSMEELVNGVDHNGGYASR